MLVDGRATLARVSADDGVRSKYPDIALEGTRGAVTWFDERDGNREVYLAVAPSSRAAVVGGGHVTPCDADAGRIDRRISSLGIAERVGLAWSDDSSGNYEVFFQPFDAPAIR